MKRSLLIAAAVLATLTAAIGCDTPEPPAETPAKKPTELTIQQPAKIRAAFDGYTINDLARYIAGKTEGLPKPFEQHVRDGRYLGVKRQLDAAWASYAKRHLAPMEAWRSELAGKTSTDVFYPFGGPDVTHPTTLFPDARRYTLIGLEDFGQVPDPISASPAAAGRQIASIHNAMSFVMGHNFFRTNSMRVQIGSQPYNGVMSLLLLFLARLDMEVIDAYQIAIDAQGKLVAAEGELKATGARVIFREPGKHLREINFIQTNISDEGVSENAPLAAYLKNRRDVTTMLKAASFLMFRSSFDDVRNVILSQSRLILSDDSGMPFSFLDNEGWKLTGYGDYLRPIPLFRLRYEPDRRAFFVKHKAKRLPFKYGYHPTRYHVIVAERAASNPFSEPTFDGGEVYGWTNVYSGGRHSVYEKKRPANPET